MAEGRLRLIQNTCSLGGTDRFTWLQTTIVCLKKREGVGVNENVEEELSVNCFEHLNAHAGI